MEAFSYFHDLLYGFLCCCTELCNQSVLIQDNEPLMRALSKLINLNNPDLVLFVGEALVGNDAVDQLSKFDQVRSWCTVVIDTFVFAL